MKKSVQRYMAGLLAGIISVTAIPALPVKAEETYEEVYAYDLDTMKEQILNSEDAESYSNGAVTFPGAGTAVNMGSELVYHLFRQGNTEKEQKVTLATQDLTAGYGTDYEIVVDGEVIDGKANILMDGKGVTYDVYLDGSNGDTQAGENEEESAEDSLSEDEKETLKDESSSMFDLTFAPGEQLKEIRVRAKVPKKAEANKDFQISIYECDNDLEQGEYKSSVITLQETREKEQASVKVLKDSAKVVDGYVTVLVERTGNTSEYTSYDLTAENGTAVNGEDFIMNSSQLLFTPGVSRQRIHIPLVSSDGEEKKEFTLRTSESEEKITYMTTENGASEDGEEEEGGFTRSRELIDISMADFVIGDSTKAVGKPSYDEDSDHERYKFGFSTSIGDGTERNASIRTSTKYDFTGIEAVKFSASYAVGSVAGDHLNVYVSNEDYAKNEAMFGTLPANQRLECVTDLTGQGMHSFSVDKKGEYFLYFSAEQHSGFGYIGFYLYDQDFSGKDKGHTALVKKKYKLEAKAPRALGDNVFATDVKLTLKDADFEDSGANVDAYRDEAFEISFKQLDNTAKYVGYQLQDASGNVYYTKRTESKVFTLTSDIIAAYENKFVNDTMYISPMFEYGTADVKILQQDFSKMGDGNLKANIDAEKGEAIYYDSGSEIAKVKWDPKYIMNSTVTFTVEENKNYNGEYHLTAFKESSGSSSTAVTNPVYHSATNKEWSVKLEKSYYEITPIISNKTARLLLNVSGASHGKVDGIPENFTGDEYTVEDYDTKGDYNPGDIAIFAAKPDDGYRAKWSYRDVASGETKTYYGSIFYYQVQVPLIMSDNYVSLTFEKCDDKKACKVTAEVYMQGGNLLHEPEADSDVYTPFEEASVTLEGTSRISASDGKAGVFELNAVPGETYTALVLANNRQYIQDVVIPSTGETSICQKMKLSYYYEGPRVTSVRYYSFDGAVQNGDTIYLSDSTDSVILATEIEKAGQNVTDVIYKLKDSNGALKSEEHVAERNGSEYIWSAQLGMEAQEGDQIWVELIEEKKDKNGRKSRISYGEVNTGYNIVKAEYKGVSYIPSIGVDQVFKNIPIFGNMYFMFDLYGVSLPTFTISKSNNITFLTIGLGGKVKKGDKWEVSNPKSYFEKVGEALKGKSKSSNGEDQGAVQQLGQSNFIFKAALNLQFALYPMVNENTKNSEMVVVGTWLSFGISGTFAYNIPEFIGPVPVFVNITFGLSLSDTLQVQSTDPTGYTSLTAMNDPKSSAFKPENDFNAEFPATIYLGVGVNGIADLAGGGTAKFTLDWVNWSWGKIKMNLTLNAKLELLIFGGSVSYNVANYTLYDNNPYTQQSLEGQNQLLDQNLSEFRLKSASDYQQSVEASGDGTLLSDAYEYSRPMMYPMGGNKYLVAMTVDRQNVEMTESTAELSGVETENAEDVAVESETGDEKRPVLAYAIYDTESGYQTGSDGKIFHSIEPASGQIDKSINFHPSITRIGDSGKYLITWNSILYKNDAESLNLSKARTVVRAAVYNSESGEIEEYRSLVTEADDKKLMSSIVLDTAYDETNNEVVVLYRALNLSGLDENSKLIDYARAGSKLMCTSLKLDGNSETTFSDSVEIASGGKTDSSYNIIKTADLEMMNGKPVIAYQMTSGEQANLISTAEEGSSNHIYLAELSHQESGGYTLEKSADIMEKVAAAQSKEEKEQEDAYHEELANAYHAQPQLLSYTKGGKELHLLVWRTENGIASIDPEKYLNNPDGYAGNEENVSALMNGSASSMGDYQIIQGEDGKIYSIWVEGNTSGTGNQVKMAALENLSDGTASWGTGSTVFETDGYIQALSPSVDSSGTLHVMYRSTALDETGKSDIVLKNIDLTEEKLEAETNLGLEVSDLMPTAGETLTIKGHVKNNGVQLTTRKELTLYVNGQPTSQKAVVPALASGMEKDIEFTYQVPDDYNGSSKLKFSVQADKGTLTQETATGAMLEVEDLDFKQLTYLGEGSDTVSFNVKASITNTGNDVAEGGTFAVSHIEYGKENGQDSLLEQLFGTCDIPTIKPGETKRIRFKLDIPKEYFDENVLHVANIAVELYSNYGQDNQILEDMFQDAIKAEEAPEVTTLTVEKTKKIGVKQSLCLNARVEPATAQEFAGFTYESSDPSIATVDKNGIVTGIKTGTCTITVTTKNGLKKVTTIQVTKEAVDDGDNKKDPTDQPDANGSGNGSNGNGSSKDSGSGQKSNAKTGDNSPVLPMSILFVLCGMIIVCEVAYKRRNS